MPFQPSRTTVAAGLVAAIAAGLVVAAPGPCRAADGAGPAASIARSASLWQPLPWRGGGLRTYGNLRAGVGSGSPGGRPTLCLELSPLPGLGLEGCGTGSGFLHHDPRPELAHFRARWRLLQFGIRQTELRLAALAGFAELQVGEDAPGFRFGETGGDGTATAGPEGGVALKLSTPLGRGFELVGSVDGGVAWLPAAGALAVPHDRRQPFAGMSVGVGY